MKPILLIVFSFFFSAALLAQKKPVAKAASAPSNSTTGSQKEGAKNSAKTGAVPAVYMVNGTPEEYKKFAGDARSNYDAGKLDDARFALQQMLAELDMIIGKEVLKVLPASLMDKPAVARLDNVSGASGFLGVIIHREYGKEHTGAEADENKNVSIEIISNSPLIASINTLLSLPLIGNTGDNKVIKIAGYKALMSKSQGSNNETNYELQLPMGSSLISLKAPGATQEQVAQMANSLPVQDISRMLQ